MHNGDWRPSASREVLAQRAGLLAQIRKYFTDRDVLEVDTPVVSQGIASEPQLTSFALQDAPERHLITSPEFAMKRLLAAGSGAIYRLGPVFRADEVGRWHNPEFCMLEWYRPGYDYVQLMHEIAALLQTLAPNAPDMQRRSVAQVFADTVGLNPHTASAEQLRAVATERGWAPAGETSNTREFWLDLILGLGVAENLGGDSVTLVYDYPASLAMLTQLRDDDPPVAERFELYWHGVELANGGTELTDPEQLRQRFDADRCERERIGADSRVGDSRLLAAQRHGLPACAGVALGVDRLLALTLGFDSIAPVLPFAWERA